MDECTVCDILFLAKYPPTMHVLEQPESPQDILVFPRVSRRSNCDVWCWDANSTLIAARIQLIKHQLPRICSEGDYAGTIDRITVANASCSRQLLRTSSPSRSTSCDH